MRLRQAMGADNNASCETQRGMPKMPPNRSGGLQRAMSLSIPERIELHDETARRLVLIERCSGLSTADFCKAILTLSTNDTILRTALNRGTYETFKGGKPQLPIKTGNDEFVLEPPK